MVSALGNQPLHTYADRLAITWRSSTSQPYRTQRALHRCARPSWTLRKLSVVDL